jgi:cytochrome c oxidase assembly protein subunit 11
MADQPASKTSTATKSSTATDHRTASQRGIRRTAIACVAGTAAMLGAAYAAVPLYDLFCKVTGYGGTPRIATESSKQTGQRVFTVRFDANVQPGLPWRFEPEQASIQARVGDTQTVFYKIRNAGPAVVTGIASFNVLPELTGGYFNKIQCFCFTEITLQPGEVLEAPVVFFIDPEIDKNADLKTATTITLSYSFFPAKGSPKPVAGIKDAAQPRL